MAKPKNPRPKDDIEVVSVAPHIEKAKRLILASLEDLESGLAKLGKTLRNAKKHDDKLWSHHAWMTERVSLVLDKLRRVRSDELRDGRNLSVALVRSFLEQLEPNERRRWTRELEAMDDGRSVLA